ncbi:MAG: DUF3486 family protein [Candidatus Methylomirabilis sp.]|nr:DUF3486 family protein [Deltaproteobacteria bacterium]
MGVPSKVEKLPDEIRDELLKRFPKKRLTLADLGAWLEERGYTISRSALQRARSKHEAAFEAIRQTEAAAQALGRELGDMANDKTGDLAVQVVKSLVFKAGLAAAERGEDGQVDLEAIFFLARSLKDTMQAARASTANRSEILKQLKAEQLAKIEKIEGESKEVKDPAALLRRIREEVYGMTT